MNIIVYCSHMYCTGCFKKIEVRINFSQITSNLYWLSSATQGHEPVINLMKSIRMSPSYIYIYIYIHFSISISRIISLQTSISIMTSQTGKQK